MKLITTKKVNIRYQSPNKQARIKGVINEGFEIEVVEEVIGENIDGNDRWYVNEEGDYFWSGDLKHKSPEVNITDAKIGWGLKKLKVPDLWEHSRGKGVKVAVMDTGIDQDHQDLKGIVDNCYNFVENTTDVTDYHGHGTRCAGIIASQGLGELVGIAKESKLLIGKIMETVIDGYHHGDLINGINWAVTNGANVISISAGGKTFNIDVQNAINRVVQEDKVTIVAAIGNSGKTGNNAGTYPARDPNCISVGAVDQNLEILGNTDKNPILTITAPGKDIITTDLEQSYNKHSGTSMACPFISGVIALLLARNKNLTADEIKKILIDTSTIKQYEGFEYRIIEPLAAFNKAK